MPEITGDARLYSAGVLVSSAVSIVGKTLKSGQFDNITVAAGGVAIANEVDANAQIVASTGGSASRTTVGSNGALHIYSGGSVRDTRVKQSGYLGIGNGALASNTYIDYAGALTVWGGGVVNSNTIDTYGAIILSSGAKAEYSVINSLGGLHVYSGAVASNTTVNQGGFFGVGLGATTFSTTVGYAGELKVWGGGVVSENTIDTWGAIILLSGARADSTVINSLGGLHVYSGAEAFNTTVKQGGFFGVGDGATTYNTSVGYAGELKVWGGGIVNSNTIDTYGAIILLSGASANSTTILANGGLHIYDGAVAVNTVIDEGATLGVGLGGYLSQVTQRQNSNLVFYEGAMLGGANSFEGSITVMGGINAASSVIELNLSNRLPDMTACIDNVDMIYGASYKVKVDKSQTAGIYTLSSNAGAFNQSVTISLEGSETTVSVGQVTALGTLQFALYKSGAALCFSVGHLETPQYVKFYKNWNLVQSVPSAAGWTIGAAQTADFVDAAGGSISNFTVEAGGTVALSLGGTANTIQVNGGNFETTRSATATNITIANGYVTAASSGVASQTTVESGSLIVEHGGRAFHNTARNNGWIAASSHGYAQDNAVESGGYAQVKEYGILDQTVLRNQGTMLVSRNGVASNTTVTSGALMRLYQDGRAEGVTLQGTGGVVEVDCGATVNNLSFVSGAAGLTAELGSGTNINGTSSGVPFAIVDGKVSGLNWSGHVINVSSGIDLFLNLHAGGLVEASVLSAGHIQVSAGAAANNNQLHYYAQLNVSAGGTATGNTADSEAEIYVCGGRLFSTTINQDGYVWVSSEGIAAHTVVNSGGRFDIGSSWIADGSQGPVSRGGNGGFASDTTVNSGGYFQVISGTSSTMTHVCNGGTMFVDTGKADNIQVDAGAGLYVKYTGVVSDVTMSGGETHVYRAGKIASITMNAGEIHATSDCDPHEQDLPKDRPKFISSAALYRDGAAIQSAVIGGGALFLSAGAAAESVRMSDGITYLVGGEVQQLQQTGGSLIASQGRIGSWEMSVSGYGEVQSCTVSSVKVQGTFVVSSGADVNITGTLGATQLYLHGGSVNSWTVGEGCHCEMKGGTLGGAAVTGNGTLVMSAGQITSPLRQTGGQIHLRGGQVSQLQQTSGSVVVSSGSVGTWTMSGVSCYGEVRNGTVSVAAAQGTLKVISGASVNITQTPGAAQLYLSGGSVNSWTVGNGGYCEMTGGTLGSAAVTGSGTLVMSAGQIASPLQVTGGQTHLRGGQISQVRQTSGSVLVSSGTVSAWTMSGNGWYGEVGNGVVSSLAVSGGGALHVKAGQVNSLTQGANQTDLHIYGGTVNAWTMGANCYGAVHGGTVSSVNAQGTLLVSSGASVNAIQTLGIATLYLSGGTVGSLTAGNGGFCEMTGGSLGSAAVTGSGVLHMTAGRITSLNQGANQTDLHIYGGTVNAWTMGANCYGAVHGGVVSSVQAQGNLVVDAGSVNTVQTLGTANLHLSGGSVGSWSFGSGCYCEITGGTLGSASVSGSGVLVMSAGQITSLTQGANQTNLRVNGGAVNAWTMGASCYGAVYGGSVGSCSVGGILEIASAASVANAKVIGGGRLALNASTNLSGSLVFDLSGLNGNDTVMVQNLNNNTCGTTAYSIALSTGQATGTYQLASGTAGFAKTVSITVNGASAGSIGVGGTFTYGTMTGTLALEGGTGNLRLDIGSTLSGPLSGMAPVSSSAPLGGDLPAYDDGDGSYSAASERFTDMLDFDADPGAGSLAGSLLADPAGSLFGNDTEKTVSPLFALA